MSVSLKLVLLLTLPVGAIMAVASLLSLQDREARLYQATHDEVRAHANTLRIALEETFNTAATAPAAQRQLINRLGENRKIYGVVLFDAAGKIQTVSNSLLDEVILHPAELDKVIGTRQPAESERTLGADQVFSIITPLEHNGRVVGAFEISQPVYFVRADIIRARRNFALITGVLLATIFAVVTLVLRRGLSRPIAELIVGAHAVGAGDLTYRVRVPDSAGEFATLAYSFNQMADHLVEQHSAVARAATARLQLERELRHSERLAAVGRLAAGVAHEIGAPLNVIDARAEQLLNKPDAPREVQQRNLLLIRKQTTRIAHIVRQLLTLARPYNLHRAALDLNALIRETLEGHEEAVCNNDIRIDFSAATQPVSVFADADFLKQVLTNILLNAVQAMPDGGRLEIECRADAAERDGVRFTAVRIGDTGAGIQSADLEHIFEPFFTTKDVGKGTGLGLPVSRRIVEEHGGWIEVVNRADGAGAIFTFYLPQASEENQP